MKKGNLMKTIGTVVCALAMAAGCVDVGPTSDESTAALTGSGSGSSTGSGTATVFHSTWNGHSASFYAWDYTTGGYPTSYTVAASESGTGTNRSVSLSFQFQGPDPSSYTCYTYNDWWWGSWTYCYYTAFINEYGWGQIPSSDFQVSGNASAAHLHTTTDSSFVIQKCSWSWYQWYFSCTTGGSETFDLSWNDNHQSSFETNGTTKQTWGGYAYSSQGKYQSVSADVAGTAFGRTLSGIVGNINDSRGTSVSRDVMTVQH